MLQEGKITSSWAGNGILCNVKDVLYCFFSMFLIDDSMIFIELTCCQAKSLF